MKFPSNEDCKPEDCNPDNKFSTSQLIVQAISASKEKQLSSSEIHNYIKKSHPEYKKSKADISNALASNRCHSIIDNRRGVAGAVIQTPL